MKKECVSSKFIFIYLFVILLLILVVSVSAGQLKVTNEHPFLIDEKWIPASELKIGDLITTAGGKKVKIIKITDIVLDKPILVYNLEANPFNNFVLSDGIVVHNSNKPFECHQCVAGQIIGSCLQNGQCGGITFKNFKVFKNPETGKIYLMLNKGLAISQDGINDWMLRHSVDLDCEGNTKRAGDSVIYGSNGKPWTQQQAKDFIVSVLIKMDNDYTPRRGFYESQIFNENGIKKKIIWAPQSSLAGDKTFTQLIGGDIFHGKICTVK